MTGSPGGQLHVVILGDWLPFPHGMATTGRAVLMARALRHAGVHVQVLCLQATERPPNIENVAVRGEYMGIPYEYAPGTTMRRKSFLARRVTAAWGWSHGVLRLIQLRREGRLDLAYLVFWTPRPAGHLLCFLALLRLLGVPVVREVNESTWSQKPELTFLERVWSPLAGVDGAVTISTELHQWAARETRSRPDFRILDVPILVDIDEQRPRDYPTGKPVVVFAGSPEYQSTIRFILSAMNEVWRTHPQCRMTITGTAPADPRVAWLRAWARQAGFESRIDIAGYLPRSELLELYSRAHVLLIPLFDDRQSRARFPTKIGEYLAVARPVVTNAVGEIPQYFTDGVDAVVCPPNDSAAFGHAVAQLLSDPTRAALIGRRGRQLAEARFHYARYGDMIARGLTEIAGTRGPLGRRGDM